jgi:hypothetical protein
MKEKTAMSMIVKVQISLSTTEVEPQVLIMDEERAFFEILGLSTCPELEDAMADTGPLRRAFFEAHVVDRKLQLGQRLPEQGW